MPSFPKPSASLRRWSKDQLRKDRIKAENNAKAKVRRRDKKCRFPLCGCGKLKWPLEVSHQVDLHKGMGGNPAGDRSTPEKLILICRHRHRDGHISIHKGTLRIVPLTELGTEGPVAFRVLFDGEIQWTEVARELRPHALDILTEHQRATLLGLADMRD